MEDSRVRGLLVPQDIRESPWSVRFSVDEIRIREWMDDATSRAKAVIGVHRLVQVSAKQ